MYSYIYQKPHDSGRVFGRQMAANIGDDAQI